MPDNVARFERNAWRDALQTTTHGVVKANLRNACHVIREAPEFRGKITYDEFAMRTYAKGAMPWDNKPARAWTNFDDSFATEWLQDHDVPVGREIVQIAVETVAYENRFHPVKEWLDSLSWDGEARIDDWLTYFLGAKRSDYVQQVGRAWLISAVARIFQPGCKADHVIIFEGKQGARKSTAIRTLASEDWYTDELAEFGSKDAGLQMRGVWIIELAELDHLSRSEAGRIKAFISRSTDRFRPPYGARLVEAPRECVFAGTVNQDEYLKDETGGRRFWPVKVGPTLDIDGLAAQREQIWAEAVRAYKDGEPWWLTDKAVERDADAEQADRQETDAWEQPIAEWVRKQAIQKFSTTQILTDAILKRPADISDRDYKRVNKVMFRLGYKRGSVDIGGMKTKGWKPASHWNPDE